MQSLPADCRLATPGELAEFSDGQEEVLLAYWLPEGEGFVVVEQDVTYRYVFDDALWDALTDDIVESGRRGAPTLLTPQTTGDTP